jgi:hypothetical protein
MSLLDRGVRKLLDRMRLAVRPRTTANRQGGHRSPIKATGVEFADHRPYVPGDDVRHLDWKAFARHRHLVLRQFEEERDSWLHVLLDVTGSMTRATRRRSTSPAPSPPPTPTSPPGSSTGSASSPSPTPSTRGPSPSAARGTCRPWSAS